MFDNDWMYQGMGGTAGMYSQGMGMTIPSSNQTPAANPVGFMQNMQAVGSSMLDTVGGMVDDFQATPWLDSFNKGTGEMTQGKLAPTLGALGMGANIFMGMKQLDMAKEQMNFQKNSWQKQFDLQKSEFDYARKRRDERQASYDQMKSRI